MTTTEIARRANARQSGKGWIARCPAHQDRSPSLSIREGRDGKTLIRCFAGCPPAAVANAWGIRLSDLFAAPRAAQWRWNAPSRVVQADHVEESLQAELARIVSEESERAGFDVAELARHRNEARRVIERRYGVQLEHEKSPWWEIAPHALDPAWTACIDQALVVGAVHRGISANTLRTAIRDLPRTQELLLQYARGLHRSLVPEPASSRSCPR